MTDHKPSNRQITSRRLIVGLGVALVVIAVAVMGFLLGLGVLGPAESTPAAMAQGTTQPPTRETTTGVPPATPPPTATQAPMPTASPSPTPELGTSNVYIEYILDASGSMNEKLPDGTVKLAVAKDVLRDFLGSFLPETNIGLRAYGHRVYYKETAKSCEDVELIAPVEKGQMEAIATWLQDFKAQGMTPLAESIRLAMKDFVFDPARKNSIVMLSDGIETCEGDPCGLVEESKAEGIEFTFHVIGLQVDNATRKQLRCIARPGGGTYHDASSAQDLKQALGDIKTDATEGEVIAPFGVDTPTPALPMPTNTPIPPTPTDTLIPPTVTYTPIPPTPSHTPKPATAKPALQGRIVFVTDRHAPDATECWDSICNTEIYVMNANGSDPVRLTSFDEFDLNPVWSPDGKRIAYATNRERAGYTKYDIYVMNSDGSSQARITDNVSPSIIGLSWSPDGKRIAFGAEALAPVSVLVINADGSGQAHLTTGEAWDHSPCWSPDGKRIVFVSDRHGNDEIYVMKPDGSGVTRLTNNAASDRRPVWSPDGRLIAFSSNRDGNSQIYVMNADGSGVERLTKGPGDKWSPAWSPDGTSITFVSDRDGNWEIYAMSANGGGVTRLTNSPANEWDPAWTK